MLDKSLFNGYVLIRETNNVIHWKRIYTVDSVIYLSYNLTLVDKCYYYSFKIFPCFWLGKTTCTIHQNQRLNCHIEPMTPVPWRHRETYPPPPSASVDNTLLDLQNSSYPIQPHSIIANSTFEQPGHGVLIDKYLNASVSTGSCQLVSPWLWRHKEFNIIFCTCLWASAACLTSL